jgi:hypothetical protein
MGKHRFFLALWLAVSPGLSASQPQTGGAEKPVRVVIDDQAPGPIRFGAEELRNAAAALGGRDLVVYLAEKRNAIGPVFSGLDVPAGEEAFTVAVRDRDTIVILGSDAAGAMYGAFEVVENWRLGTEPGLLRRTRQVTSRPFLAVRGVNM